MCQFKEKLKVLSRRKEPCGRGSDQSSLGLRHCAEDSPEILIYVDLSEWKTYFPSTLHQIIPISLILSLILPVLRKPVNRVLCNVIFADTEHNHSEHHSFTLSQGTLLCSKSSEKHTKVNPRAAKHYNT